MTNVPISALDALTALGGAEQRVSRGDDPDGILPAIRDAHRALDDLIDHMALRAAPWSRLAVLDALQNCADQYEGFARWYGNRAYYGAADGELIDITAVIAAHPTLFRRDRNGYVLTDHDGRVLLDQWDYDRRHPVRALLAEALGRRQIRPARSLTGGQIIPAGAQETTP
jgi:hypothetical protein